MAASATYVYSPNTRIKSAEMNQNFTDAFPTFETFTPTWSGATGAPAIGNGTLTGRYAQHGKIIVAHYYLLWGDTTSTAGSGAWYFTFPVPQNTTQQLFSGQGYCVNTGAGFSEMFYVRPQSNTTVDLHNYGGAAIGEGAPFAWATADYLNFTIVYEAA